MLRILPSYADSITISTILSGHSVSTILSGYGDTLKSGDVFYDDKGGPYLFDACSKNDKNPWYSYTTPYGNKIAPYYRAPIDCPDLNWSRKFRLADEQTSKKLKDALSFEGYVRLYISFSKQDKKILILVPACWIAWVGDLEKAFLNYDSSYGKLKKKNIVHWVKGYMYRDSKMKSKIPVPKDFPVKL